MKALGLVEVYSFTTAVCVADIAAKTSNVKIIAFDRNRPISPDVPAPLVMVVKFEGDVAAVRAAVDASVEYAKAEGKYIVSHIIPNPGIGVEKMAYLMDLNKDKYNKKLPKSFLGIDYPAPENNNEAIGLLEVQGLVAAIEGADSMLKAADVRLIHSEKRLGGRLVTFIIKGKVDAVTAAIQAGEKSAEVIIIKFFDIEE